MYLKYAFILFIPLCPEVCISINANNHNNAISGTQHLFDKWVKEYQIEIYELSHYNDLFHTWSYNHLFIQEVNGKNLSYTLGHNQFSGLKFKEYQEYLVRSSKYQVNNSIPILDDVEITLPASVDWVKNGGVSDVKNQGSCGSCWSFSTTGALEGAYYVKYNELVSFSEQQLVDCDILRNGGFDSGCNGGFMDNAFKWISHNGGLCSENDYPYVSGDTTVSGVCVKECDVVKKSIIKSFVDVQPSSDIAMMTALSLQPVSVAIQADQREFQFYNSGVYTGSCGDTLGHGVLAVGYGTLNGEKYYKVKNSWGTTWGDNGYILLGRGTSYNNGNGQCGILLQASYPVL